MSHWNAAVWSAGALGFVLIIVIGVLFHAYGWVVLVAWLSVIAVIVRYLSYEESR